MLVKQHAMELAPYRINVNGVAPTLLTRACSIRCEKMKAFWIKRLRKPAGLSRRSRRCGRTDDILCSRAAEYITGQILYVDGGITASQ